MADTRITDSSPGTSCMEIRKKAKKDSVEENPQQQQLVADVWERLPESLIDEVFTKRPFSSLFRFSCVCKRLRASILTRNPHLAFFHAGKLLVLNPNRSTWESVSISFLPVDRLSSLSLVASAGGLLCFRTKSFDEFLVCNPLTRSWRTVQVPWGEVQTPWGEVTSGRLEPIYSRTALRKFHRCKSMPKFFLVGMILHSDETHFKLIVAYGVIRGQRPTLVYDSCSDCWEKVDGVLDDGGSEGSGAFQEAQTIACGGNLYSTIRTTNDMLRLVKFDVQRRMWRPIDVPTTSNSPRKLLGHNGKILLMSGNPRNPSSFELYELKDSEITSWSPFKSLPLMRLFEAMGRRFGVSENLEILECLGQGDSMFCIGSKSSTSQASLRSPSSSSKLSLTVGVHNFSSNSDTVTGWEDLQIMGGNCQLFPTSWQILRPSWLPCV